MMENMKFLMTGRVDANEFWEGVNYTCITTPAVDSYSKPSTFKVRSPSQLGAVGTELDLIITVTGYVRTNTWDDKKTGEKKSYKNATVRFDAELAGQSAMKKAG